MTDQSAAQSNGAPVLEVLTGMTVDSLEASSLEPDVLMLVRLAALVAVDAPVASYLLNLGAAAETGITLEQVQGVLTAVAPITGGPRVVAAVAAIAEALGVAIDLAQQPDE